MRITGGILAGRTVICPGGTIRPAMDRMRESLFAILGDLAGKSFLDLFSGSGVCALEASSRGAHPVYLVEKDPVKVETIFRNIAMAPNRIECKFQPVELFLKRARTEFDILYMDPPFPYKYHRELIEAAGNGRVCAMGGMAIIHRPRELDMPVSIGIMHKTDQREYGRSIIDFYTKG